MGESKGCCRKYCHLILFAVGFITLALGVGLIFVFKAIIKQQVLKNVLLTNGTMSYEQWVEPDIPIYMQFYVFNVTNVHEVLLGGKPYLQEIGPYTYREYRKKVDIQHNDNGTVTYRQIKYWVFNSTMSNGRNDSDVFTTINIPVMTLISSMMHTPELLNMAAELLMFVYDENLFVSRSVREIAFGYHDPLLTVAKSIIPDWFYSDFVGVLAGKNNTDDGVYTVFTGEKDMTKLGVIDKYNGTSMLKFWTTDSANMINGSDGTLSPPLIDDTSMPMPMFSTDICRSIFGVYGGEEHTSKGIPLRRFSGPQSEFASKEENPDNAGFCTPADTCMGTGVLNMSACQLFDYFHVPIVASLPHFLMADEKYKSAIGNMHPDPVQHRTDINIEPYTGLAMKIFKRLQINIYVHQVPHIRQTENVTEMVFPVLWLNESANIDNAEDQQDKVINMLLTPVLITKIVQYGVIGLGGAMLLISLILALVIYRRKLKDGSLSIQSGDTDRDSLLNSDDRH